MVSKKKGVGVAGVAVALAGLFVLTRKSEAAPQIPFIPGVAPDVGVDPGVVRIDISNLINQVLERNEELGEAVAGEGAVEEELGLADPTTPSALLPTASEVAMAFEAAPLPTSQEAINSLAATIRVLEQEQASFAEPTFGQIIEGSPLVRWVDPVTGNQGLTSPEAVPPGAIIIQVLG